MISVSTGNISKNEVKKYLYISIVEIICMIILIILNPLLLSLLPSRIPSIIIFSIQVPLIMWLLIVMVQAIISLIFYFVNHEIMYGMWKRKEKTKKFTIEIL